MSSSPSPAASSESSASLGSFCYSSTEPGPLEDMPALEVEEGASIEEAKSALIIASAKVLAFSSAMPALLNLKAIFSLSSFN